MNNRLNKIETKLGLVRDFPITYQTILFVDKNKNFDETIAKEKTYGASNNHSVNKLQGDRYLGSVEIKDLPAAISNQLKDLYFKAQNEIRDNPDAGASLLFLNLSSAT